MEVLCKSSRYGMVVMMRERERERERVTVVLSWCGMLGKSHFPAVIAGSICGNGDLPT